MLEIIYGLALALLLLNILLLSELKKISKLLASNNSIDSNRDSNETKNVKH